MDTDKKVMKAWGKGWGWSRRGQWEGQQGDIYNTLNNGGCFFKKVNSQYFSPFLHLDVLYFLKYRNVCLPTLYFSVCPWMDDTFFNTTGSTHTNVPVGSYIYSKSLECPQNCIAISFSGDSYIQESFKLTALDPWYFKLSPRTSSLRGLFRHQNLRPHPTPMEP